MRCGWCLEGHALEQCPNLGSFVMRTPDPEPTTAEEALQYRLHALRAALRGMLVDARRAGLTLSPETAAMVAAADSFDP